MFHAMRYRNFRLFFIGQLVSVAGTWMQSVAQNWLVWRLVHNSAWLGVVTAAGAVPILVFTLYGGKIADNYSRRNILIITQIVQMVLAFALALLASSWSPVPISVWDVVIISGLNGLCASFNMPAQQSFLVELVDDREALSNAIALNSIRFNIARALGPLIAGIVLVKSGDAACFFFNGLSFLAVIISLIMMRLPEFKRKASGAPVLGGVKYIFKTPAMLQIMLLIFASSVFVGPATTLFPALAAKMHGGAEIYSMLMVANGMGAAMAGLMLAALARSFHKGVLLYGSICLGSLCMVVMGNAPYLWLLFMTVIGFGFSNVLFGIGGQIVVQELVPDELRGRVMSVYTIIANGRFSTGSLEVGALGQYAGPPVALLINACITLVIMGTVGWKFRKQQPL